MGATDITFATTIRGDGCKFIDGVSGVALLAGQFVYVDLADGGKFKLARGNALSTSLIKGVCAVSCPAANQPCRLYIEGRLTGLTGLTGGAPYFISETTPGAAMRVADIGAADFAEFLGKAFSATEFDLHIFNNSVVHA